jgi:hypothetical protein
LDINPVQRKFDDKTSEMEGLCALKPPYLNVFFFQKHFAAQLYLYQNLKPFNTGSIFLNDRLKEIFGRLKKNQLKT